MKQCSLLAEWDRFPKAASMFIFNIGLLRIQKRPLRTWKYKIASGKAS